MFTYLNNYKESIEGFFYTSNICFKKKLISAYNTLNSIVSESFCVFTKIIPNAIRWIFKKDITSEKLKATVDGIEEYATLHFHNLKNSITPANSKAVLFLHGDHSHPCTLLPLIEIAKEKNCFVYSLKLPSDPTHSEKSQKFIDEALKEIIQNSENKKTKITMVGHSKGGIQSAFTAFVKKDERVNAVITIAGRVKCLNDDTSCHPELKPLINLVQKAITGNPDLPIYQIVPENDWMMPVSAMQIREDASTLIPQAMHLNVLYKEETKAAFKGYLEKAMNLSHY